MAIAPRMEPLWSDESQDQPKYLRVLLLGSPKIGKSVAAVGTAPGPVYCINCDQKDSLSPVTRIHPGVKFATNHVHSMEKMEDAIQLARTLVKDNKVKTIVWDTMSGFASHLEDECAEKTNNNEGVPDGRRYWPMYTKYLLNSVGRLMKLNAHLIVTSHWIDVGTTDQERDKIRDGAKAKIGPGIVPLLGRTARAKMGGEFADVIFMDKVKGERMFITSLDGVWGPGCRNVDGNEIVPADFNRFLKTYLLAPTTNGGSSKKAVKK
jgi:hypothetical protein